MSQFRRPLSMKIKTSAKQPKPIGTLDPKETETYHHDTKLLDISLHLEAPSLRRSTNQDNLQ